jgi:hypothetical protein
MKNRTTMHLAASAVLAGLVLAGAFMAFMAARPILFAAREPWLKVQAPDRASRAWPFAVAVRLADPKPGTFLHVDVHGEDSGHVNLGYMAGAGVAPVVEGRREYSFETRIPDRRDVAYVEAVIYVSSEGSWESRTMTARLIQVPLEESAATARRPVLRPTAAFPMSERDAADAARSDSLTLRVLTVLAWAACAVLAWKKRGGLGQRALSLACLGACVWELVMPETVLSELLRTFAGTEGWYVLRVGPQRALALGALAAGLGGAVLILVRSVRERRTARGSAWLGLYAYAGIAFLRVLSQHDTDAFFAHQLSGVQAGQAATSLCAGVALVALALGFAAAARGAPPPGGPPRT